MLIDTRIKSYAIPTHIWNEGIKPNSSEKNLSDYPQLPSLQLPTRDALAIELRVQRGVNLHNEQKRYTLCNNRIQEIVLNLAEIPGIIGSPLIWPNLIDQKRNLPCSRAYLAIVAVITRWMKKFLLGQFPYAYPRIPAIFFPPQHASQHYETYRLISQHPEVGQLFSRAAKEASIPNSNFTLSTKECQDAFLLRMELLYSVKEQNAGLVDIVEVL